MRVYKNAWFAKFAHKERIGDDALRDAIRRAEKGLIDADLGSGLLKQRVAREGAGKSGGYRTLIFFRSGSRAIFVSGFAKNDKANLDPLELVQLRKAARQSLAVSQESMDAAVKIGRLIEVSYGEQSL